jgi:ribosomal protein S18 acetylase RimI-like enzyme
MTPENDDDNPCEELPWDTQFFGLRVARVRGHTLTPARAADIDQWSRRTGTSRLYFLANADDPATTRAAEDAGFHLAEIRMTLDREVERALPPVAPPVRHYAPADLPALRDLGRTSYTDSRFYQDPRIPREKADEFFDLWTQKLTRESPAGVLVAEVGGQVAGYVACDTSPADPRTGKIVLIAVDAAARGQGLGRALVESAVAWSAARGLARVEVVTQGRNVPAQRLYQRCGFVTQSVQLQYHKSYDEPGPRNPRGPGTD